MEDYDIIKRLKEIEQAVKNLQTRTMVVNLTIPDAGTFRVPTGASNPAGGSDGELFYNTATDKLNVRANGSWVAVH
jgi:hypothetical protein